MGLLTPTFVAGGPLRPAGLPPSARSRNYREDSGRSFGSRAFLAVVGTPSIPEWAEVGKLILKMHDASVLWVGDWYNYGGAHYYGKAVEIAEELRVRAEDGSGSRVVRGGAG